MKLYREKVLSRRSRAVELLGRHETQAEFHPLAEIDLDRLMDLASQRQAPIQAADREEVYHGAWVTKLSPPTLDMLRASPWLKQAWFLAIQEEMTSPDLATVSGLSSTVRRALEHFYRFVQIFPEERQHAPFSQTIQSQLMTDRLPGDMYDEIISRGVALLAVYPKDHERIYSEFILKNDNIGNYRAFLNKLHAEAGENPLLVWGYYCFLAEFLLLFPDQHPGLMDQIKKDFLLLHEYTRQLRHEGVDNAEYRFNNQMYFLTLLLAENARIEDGEVLFTLPPRSLGRFRPLPPRPQVESS